MVSGEKVKPASTTVMVVLKPVIVMIVSKIASKNVFMI
jgi:hypothetical protein